MSHSRKAVVHREDRELRERAHGSGWVAFLGELDWWVEQHGEAPIPQAATSREIGGAPYPLGQRVKTLRVRYRQGKLAESRIRELEARAGWSWSGYTARSASIWQRRIAALNGYVAEHGSLEGLEAADPLLARWLRAKRDAPLTNTQRRELGRIPGALEQRREKLEEFLLAMRGWIAAEPDRDAGDLRFSTVFRIGRVSIPLGRRAAYWRSRYAADQLDDATIAAVASLPGWEWSNPTQRNTPPVTDA